ncbi:MAG: hypothetical protein JSR54_02815 [Proteobacteria bacterium]|nr:hypothetical protein [Pseudomonadota bacterium]
MKAPTIGGIPRRGEPARRGPDGYVIATERRRMTNRAPASRDGVALPAPASPRVLRALIASADGLRDYLALRAGRAWTARDLSRTGSEVAELVRRYQSASRQLLQEWLRRPRHLAWLADSSSGRVLDIVDTGEDGAVPQGLEIHPTAVGDQTAHGLWRRFSRPGVGVPVVTWVRRTRPHHVKRLARYTAAQARTAVVLVEPDFDRRVRAIRIVLADPVADATVRFGTADLPLAADFTAPVALTLTRERRPATSAYGLREPSRRGTVDGFVALTPYSPTLAPLVLVESGALPALTMAQVANEVAGSPGLRQRYQVWLYRLPPATPLIYAAGRLRADLQRFGARLRAAGGRDDSTTIVAHGIGAAVARTLLLDSDAALWDAAFRQPATRLGFDERDRALLDSLFFWNAVPNVERVISLGEPDNREALVAGSGARAVQLLLRQPVRLRAAIERIYGLARTVIGPPPAPAGATDATPAESFFDDPTCRAIAGIALAADRALLDLSGPPPGAAAALYGRGAQRLAGSGFVAAESAGTLDSRAVGDAVAWLHDAG